MNTMNKNHKNDDDDDDDDGSDDDETVMLINIIIKIMMPMIKIFSWSMIVVDTVDDVGDEDYWQYHIDDIGGVIGEKWSKSLIVSFHYSGLLIGKLYGLMKYLILEVQPTIKIIEPPILDDEQIHTHPKKLDLMVKFPLLFNDQLGLPGPLYFTG